MRAKCLRKLSPGQRVAKPFDYGEGTVVSVRAGVVILKDCTGSLAEHEGHELVWKMADGYMLSCFTTPEEAQRVGTPESPWWQKKEEPK